jgi:environmental stress-induced protein Ves
MRLTPADYRRMPWRNGGGTTTEIAIAPEGAALSGVRFLYRVSIADVATDGPFSRFEGYDRHIMLLEGAGMTLDCGEHGTIELTRNGEPRTFSGDWDVRGALASGAVRDFNVMVDRARASSTLEARSIEAPASIACAPGDTCIIHVIAGDLGEAATGDTLVVDAAVELIPRKERARVVIARIRPYPSSSR